MWRKWLFRALLFPILPVAIVYGLLRAVGKGAAVVWAETGIELGSIPEAIREWWEWP